MFVVKFQNGDDIRRVSLEGALSVKEITELAKGLFREALPEPFSLKYKDDEGDSVTITCDQELEEAFRLFKDQGILRLIITSTARPTPPKPQPSPTEHKSALDDLVDAFSPYIEAIETQLSDVIPKIEEQIKDVFPKIEEQFKDVLPKMEETFAQAFQKQETIHPAICDGCNERIRGIRYKCTQCPDFDLCTNCNQLKIHSEHQFQRVDKPTYSRCSRASPRRCTSAPAQSPGQDDVQIPLRVVSQEAIPATPLRVVQPAKEPMKPVENAANIAPFRPLTPLRVVKEEPKKEEPKKEEPQKEEPTASPFEAKLQQLEEMGFLNRQRNIELLVKWKGDVITAVMDLLE